MRERIRRNYEQFYIRMIEIDCQQLKISSTGSISKESGNEQIADNKLLTFDTITPVKAVGKDDILDRNGMFLATIKTRFTKVKVFLRGNKLITLWVSALSEDWGNDEYATAKDVINGMDTTSLQQNRDRLLVNSKNGAGNEESPSQYILNRIVE